MNFSSLLQLRFINVFEIIGDLLELAVHHEVAVSIAHVVVVLGVNF
jgi:hypothetical protein